MLVEPLTWLWDTSSLGSTGLNDLLLFFFGFSRMHHLSSETNPGGLRGIINWPVMWDII